MTDLVPVLHGIANMIIGVSEQRAAGQGKQVSCRAGCCACCRQLVPIGEPEARSLAALVATMPPERRAHVTERFRAAAAALEPSGLLDKLRRIDEYSTEERIGIGVEYFRLGVACPFLEEQICSIHRHRPMSCRECLVTTPAELCEDPRADLVEELPLAYKPSKALCRFGDGKGDDQLRYALLVLLPEWIEAHRDDAQVEMPAPELLMNFVKRIARGAPEPAE
jgi:Fe-S-cluster containining protein